MARKSAALLPSRQKRRSASWAALGADTSMTSLAVCGVGYDALLDKMVGPAYAVKRWAPEDDYFKRLRETYKSYTLVHDVLTQFWVLDYENVYIAIEEPWYYGATKTQESAWLKQQAEIAGAFKSSLLGHGYANLHEINNSQWHAVLRRDGIEFDKAPKGSSSKVKKEIGLANKFAIKSWAIGAYGLPDLPDLVKSKSGAKIPRPESGYGAHAQAVQPDDVYDAAACAAFMQDWVEAHVL